MDPAEPRRREFAARTLTSERLEQLQAVANSAIRPHALVLRAHGILASAEGLTNALGIQGLQGELWPGRPRAYDDDRVAPVINRALEVRFPRALSEPDVRVFTHPFS